MVGHNTKMIRHQQNLNLTFTSVDLTNVRCQTALALIIDHNIILQYKSYVC